MTMAHWDYKQSKIIHFQIHSLEKENEEERERLDEFIRKFMTIGDYRTKDHTYRLILEFTDEYVRYGLVQGDTMAVEYLARRMGYELTRQLMAINFAGLPNEEEYYRARDSLKLD
ncbi:hypothetical protein HYS85_01055 [Candidatus Saccharibacteria bacterium]|nr:hypothetical protein [Candidatus Saccharibacteria bacterium]